MHPLLQPNLTRDDYCWVIDHDFLSDVQPSSDVGTMGPMKARPELLDGECETFRLLDDDGNIYYEGRIAGEYDGFEPLDDFGMPNAGCVTIQYLSKDGDWEVL